MGHHHNLAPVEEGFVAIGWKDMGDLSKLPADRDAFKARLAETHPGEKPGAIPVKAGVLYRFAYEMREGDVVIFPSKPDRMVNIGIIAGPYEYDPAAPGDSERDHRRRVDWKVHKPRADFSQSALHEIGSALTLFQVSNNADEFLAALTGDAFEPEQVDEETAGSVSQQQDETTDDFVIKRLKRSMDPQEFEHFIAALLECMGYRARVTRYSGDGGVDVIAHRDELGLEPPLIKVQCKQTQNTIGRPDVQQLTGAVEAEEKGLFVTLGNYSNDALVFERSRPNLRLLSGSDLVDLIFRHYEALPPRWKSVVPLRRHYVPGPVGAGAED
jgi:restriction system protein